MEGVPNQENIEDKVDNLAVLWGETDRSIEDIVHNSRFAHSFVSLRKKSAETSIPLPSSISEHPDVTFLINLELFRADLGRQMDTLDPEFNFHDGEPEE